VHIRAGGREGGKERAQSSTPPDASARAPPLDSPPTPTPPPPPQCAVDAAGAWALDPDRAAFKAALVDGHLGAPSPDDALLEELRARLVAAGAGEHSAPLARSLRGWKPAGGAAAGAPGERAPGVVPLFAHLTPPWPRPGALLPGPGGPPAWPALRRGLAAAGAHVIEAVLGGDGDDPAAGRVVLTGAALTAALLGVAPHPASLPDAWPPPRLPDASAAARWFDLAIVGAEGGPGAAARAVEGCVREILTR
jgi:hypothetical protein